MKRRILSTALLIAALAPTFPAPLCAQELAGGDKVGGVASLRGTLTGTLDDETLDLMAGGDVLLGQRLETGERSIAKLTFMPRGYATMRPKNELAITRLYYDERTGRSESKLESTRGTFEVGVGKVLAGENRTEFESPTTSIGVKGTRLVIRIAESDGETTVWTLEGEADDVTVTSKAGGTVILPAGYATVVAPGAAPTPPILFDEETGVTSGVALPLPPGVGEPFDDPPLPPVRENEPPDRGRNDPPPNLDPSDRP